MKTAVDEEILRLMFGNDFLRCGTHAPVTSRPIHHHKFAAGLQYAFHFLQKRKAVFYLEKRVGKQNGVERPVAQMRAAGFFNVAPNRIDNVLMVYVRVEFDVFQDVFLHIYRIHFPAVTHDRGGGARVVAGAGAEVTDLHAFSQAELKNILMGRTEMRAHIYKVPRAARP